MHPKEELVSALELSYMMHAASQIARSRSWLPALTDNTVVHDSDSAKHFRQSKPQMLHSHRLSKLGQRLSRSAAGPSACCSIRTVPSVEIETLANAGFELKVLGAAFPTFQDFRCGRSFVRLALAVRQATNWKLCQPNG